MNHLTAAHVRVRHCAMALAETRGCADDLQPAELRGQQRSRLHETIPYDGAQPQAPVDDACNWRRAQCISRDERSSELRTTQVPIRGSAVTQSPQAI